MSEEPFINIRIGKFNFKSFGIPVMEFTGQSFQINYAERGAAKENNIKTRTAFIEFVKTVVAEALEQEVLSVNQP